MKITFLGPVGATFSHDAYNVLAEKYGVPIVSVSASDENGNCVPASSNMEVLTLIIEHGGYGTLAMETLAEARINETVESFLGLLGKYKSADVCPIRVIGAIRMELHFCLMVRKGSVNNAVKKPDVKTIKKTTKKVVAHQKAIGACKSNIESNGYVAEAVSSNGEAARLVAEDERYANYAALGPRSAAEKYGLAILDEAFEDKQAITTFFLIGPKNQAVRTGKNNRILIVYKVPHTPGALVRSLLPFDEMGINMIQIHSVHAGNGQYHFAIEFEVGENQLKNLEKAMERFKRLAECYLSFGPFEVLST